MADIPKKDKNTKLFIYDLISSSSITETQNAPDVRSYGRQLAFAEFT